MPKRSTSRNERKRNAGREQRTNPTNVYSRVALLGFVTGLRSMAPLALLNWTNRLNKNTEAPISRLFSGSSSRLITTLLAAGEILGDKLPIAPGRTSVGPLIGRIAIGALVGADLCQEAQQSFIPGIAIGAASAAVGATAGYYGRKSLSRVKGVPTFVWAGAEDLLALGLGRLATRNASK